MYLNADADLIIICGDVKGRIGEECDFIEGVDNIVNRSCLDKLKNSHGEGWVHFLKDCKFGLLNGRVTSQFDNFPRVSSKGKAVVYYFALPHSRMKYCTLFGVDLVAELLQKYELLGMLSETCKAPNHSVLKAKYSWGIEALESFETSDNSGVDKGCFPRSHL